MSAPEIVMSISAWLAVCAFMLFRNRWVCRVRIAMIWSDYASYERLPSYGAMLYRFWVWDVRKFLPSVHP